MTENDPDCFKYGLSESLKLGKKDSAGMSILKLAWALSFSFLLQPSSWKPRPPRCWRLWEPSDNAHTQVGIRATLDSATVSFSSIRKDGDIVLSETRTGQGPLIFFTLTQIFLLSFTTFICKFGVLYHASWLGILFLIWLRFHTVLQT